MKKLILIFLMCLGILFATPTQGTKKEKIQVNVSVDELSSFKLENEILRKRVTDLEDRMVKATEFKEASSIYYNVDQFYKSSWERLLWILTIIGGIGALLFNKYTNTVKSEIEQSKKEIKEYTNERIKNYEELINNYRNDTINTVKDEVENLLKEKIESVNKKVQDEEKRLELILNEKSEQLKNELELQSSKNRAELKKEFEEYNYISTIKLRITLYRDIQDVRQKIYIYNSLIEEVKSAKEIRMSTNRDELLYDLNFSIAYFYNNLNEIEESIKFYQKSIEINSERPEAYNNLAIIYQVRNINKDFEEAINLYEIALKLNPNYADVYNNLGIIYQNRNSEGDFEKAIKYYEKAVELNSNYADALGNLGNAYQTRNEYNDLDKATELIEKAIKLNPNFSIYYNNLGISYCKKENVNKGIEILKKAIELNPNYADAYKNLAVAYERIGDIQNAIECYQKVIQIDPSNDEINSYLKELRI